MKKKLGLKPYPEYLDSAKIEIFWPGDPACDIESSDLVVWAKSLCTEGLVEKPGERLSTILCRRLTPRELPVVEKTTRIEPKSGSAEACSIGLLKIGDDVVLKRPSEDGIRRMADADMEPLFYHDDYCAEVPFYHLVKAMYSSMGIEIPDDPGDDALVRASLGSVIGTVILARSFRSGRRDL